MSDLSLAPSRKFATVVQVVGGYVNISIVIIQGLLLIPIYLHFIGAHTYGIWLASGGILGMLGLMNFGISSLLIQRITHAYAQQNLVQVGAYFINGAVIYLGICLLYASTGWLASIWLPSILKLTGPEAEMLRQCFQLAVLAMVIGIFNECLRCLSQALLRPMIPVVSIAFGRITGIGVTVWMLFNNYGLWSIPMGLLVSESVIFSINLLCSLSLLCRLKVRCRCDLAIIKEYMKTSPVLLMARLGDTLPKESQPLLITIFLAPELTTAYMITRRAADIVLQILNVIVGSTMSTFSHLAGSGDGDKTRKIAETLLVISFSVGVIGFSVYTGANHAFISLWVGEIFALDQSVILFIALGFFARTFRGLLGQMLYGLGKFNFPSVIILMEGLFQIALTIWLLSILGIIGVPLAFLLSCFVAMVVLGFRLKKELAMNFSVIDIFRHILSGVVIFGCSITLMQVWVGIDSWGGFLMYLMVLMASFLMIYALMNWSKYRELYRTIIT